MVLTRVKEDFIFQDLLTTGESVLVQVIWWGDETDHTVRRSIRFPLIDCRGPHRDTFKVVTTIIDRFEQRMGHVWKHQP